MSFEKDIRGVRETEQASGEGQLSQQLYSAESKDDFRPGNLEQRRDDTGALPELRIDRRSEEPKASVSTEADSAPRSSEDRNEPASREEHDTAGRPSARIPDQKPEAEGPRFPEKPREVPVRQDLAVAAENRAKYKEEVEKQVQAASMSHVAEPGESYGDVLHRMYPNLGKAELAALAAEARQANGNKELKPGDQFTVMNKEQCLRLVDQTMNEYDARHNTDLLDIHGDFAPEKGKMAGAHNSVRAAEKGQMQAALDEFEKKLPSEVVKPEPPKAPENVEMKDFAKEAQTLLPKLDLNHDSVLSHEELLAASKDSALTGKEQQVIAGLLAAEDAIKDLHNDRLGKEKGISAKDLEKLASNIAKVEEDYKGAFRTGITLSNEKLFNSIDGNHDGLLSKKELKQALENRDDLKKWQRAAIRYALQNAGEIMEVSNDEFGDENTGISKNDARGMLKHVSETEEANTVETIAKAMRAIKMSQAEYAKRPQPVKPVGEGAA
ncbi:MAG: hypothetical protein K2X77_22565 [Candidatus Obscuribacterales bacterium]|nr:hypothetical protein [Candidatus Obscuribacterales bacterium]